MLAFCTSKFSREIKKSGIKLVMTKKEKKWPNAGERVKVEAIMQ